MHDPHPTDPHPIESPCPIDSLPTPEFPFCPIGKPPCPIDLPPPPTLILLQTHPDVGRRGGRGKIALCGSAAASGSGGGSQILGGGPEFWGRGPNLGGVPIWGGVSHLCSHFQHGFEVVGHGGQFGLRGGGEKIGVKKGEFGSINGNWGQLMAIRDQLVPK